MNMLRKDERIDEITKFSYIWIYSQEVLKKKRDSFLNDRNVFVLLSETDNKCAAY